MSDSPLPPSESDPGVPSMGAPAHSVVIDEHATVPVKRWPIWVAIGGVLAFIAFTAIWYAVDGEDEYEPGPPAQALLDAASEEGVELDVSDAELACIDRVGEDIDPDVFADASDPFGEATDDPEAAAFAGAVFGECLDRTTRIDMLVWGMVAEDMSEEQARCVAEAMDDAILATGGWETFARDEEASSGMILAIFAAYDSCGIDPFGEI